MIQILNDRVFLLIIYNAVMCGVFTTTVMFHKKQRKSMSRILSGSTSIVQTETHSLVETEHNNDVQRRQQ